MDWDTLDKIGIVIGVVLGMSTVISSVGSFIILFANERRRKGKVNSLYNNPKDIESALIVDIGADNIEAAVVNWIKSNINLKKIQKKNIHYVGMTDRLTQENTDKLLQRVREERKKITNNGTCKIHLFYRGPVTFATILGAELSNKVPVILYQNDPTTTDISNKYIEYGLLNRP